MTMFLPEFQITFRRRLPIAPNSSLNCVSDEALSSRGSMEFTHRRDAIRIKKRLTPEVVAMLLSIDLGSDGGESISHRNQVLHEVNLPKYSGAMKQTSIEAGMGLSNSDLSSHNDIGMVHIVKCTGQPLGFSLREYDRSECEKIGGIYVSRLTVGGVVEQHSLLSAGDEILEINCVPVHGYKLSDVVAMIQIPKRLALKVRFRKGPGQNNDAGLRTETFTEKPVLRVNNNDICKTGQNLRGDNKRTGATSAQGMLGTNGEGIFAPKPVTFRRNSSGRILPAPPESKPDRVQYVFEDSSSSNSSKPRPSSTRSSEGLRARPSQETNLKLSNQKNEFNKHKNTRKSAVLSLSTIDGCPQTSEAGSKRVDPGDIRFDIITTNDSSSTASISPRTLDEVKIECKQDLTPTSSPLGLRKTSELDAFGSSSSLSSCDSPKSQCKRPVQAKSQGKFPNAELSKSEIRTHSSRSTDGRPLSSSAESEDSVTKDSSNNLAKQDPRSLFHHSLSWEELNQSHNSWFPKIGNQKRKHARKFSEPAQVLGPKSIGEAYRIQEMTDSSNDDVEPGYRRYVSGYLSGRTENRNTPRAVTGMLALHIGKGCKISPGEAISKDKRKKIKVFCTVDSDGIRQACTGVKKGLNDFQWNESFEIEFQRTREIKITVWMRSKKDGDRTLSEGCLCLAQLLNEGGEHMLAVCLEPCGALYVKLQFTDMKVLLQRTPSQKNEGVFGFPLETVLRRENSRIPTIVRKCVEEINIRGLEVTGIYRLCGNAAKKKVLRAQFENSSVSVDLGQTETPVDVNVITGLLKDYLRELPDPLLSQEIREVLCEASATEMRRESSDQFLVTQITKKFPTTTRVTIVYVLDHFATVLMNSDLNKMDSHNLAVCIGPVLLCPSLFTASANAVSDTKKDINAIKLLLEIWPKPEQVSAC